MNMQSVLFQLKERNIFPSIVKALLKIKGGFTENALLTRNSEHYFAAYDERLLSQGKEISDTENTRQGRLKFHAGQVFSRSRSKLSAQ